MIDHDGTGSVTGSLARDAGIMECIRKAHAERSLSFVYVNSLFSDEANYPNSGGCDPEEYAGLLARLGLTETPVAQQHDLPPVLKKQAQAETVEATPDVRAPPTVEELPPEDAPLEKVPLEELSGFIKNQTEALVQLRHEAAAAEVALRKARESMSAALLNWSLGPGRRAMTPDQIRAEEIAAINATRRLVRQPQGVPGPSVVDQLAFARKPRSVPMGDYRRGKGQPRGSWNTDPKKGPIAKEILAAQAAQALAGRQRGG